MSIDTAINDAFGPMAKAASDVVLYSLPLSGEEGGPSIRLIVLWLAVAAVFFSLYLRFISIRWFRHGIDLVTGKYKEPGLENAPGELSNFQALATCLSGTVGLGNIAGVAVAISMGGPGAALWMGLMGFFGMCSKFAEAALGTKYREKAQGDFCTQGDYVTGPMYYIKDAFARYGYTGVGKFFAGMFAFLTIGATLGGGNMFQANQVYQQFVLVTGGDGSFWSDKGWLFGVILAVLVGAVIVGGIKSIASVSSKIVPLMAIIYLAGGSVVLLAHLQELPHGLFVIFREALTPEAGIAGILGSFVAGIQRAAFSNEAGLGTAAFTHSCAKTNFPVSQGFVAMLGPFIDTVVICMMTALVIVVSGVYETSEAVNGTFQGVVLTSHAFATVMPWFPYVLAVAVFLFAYSTQITWFYYGLLGCTYLLGERKAVIWGFKVIYLLAVVVGCAASLGNVIDFTDATFLALAIPNILALYILAPELKQDVAAYLLRIKSTGKS